MTPTVTLPDLYEPEWESDARPFADRAPIGELLAVQRQWREHGWVRLPGFLPDDLLAAYEEAWRADNGPNSPAPSPGGWRYATPYMDVPELAAVVCHEQLAIVLHLLIGEPMGVHLNLTGWETTTRDWHSDQYLNEPYVGGYYVAVWIALDSIDPDSGPFEYVDRSHLWPPISQKKIRRELGANGRGPDWPTHSERILTPLFDDKIRSEGWTITQYLPKRGDVLLWHSRLLHRGSLANTPGMERRALIAHYSGINHRPDMPPAERHPAGGWYFPLNDRSGW